jgi:hypothetical protein
MSKVLCVLLLITSGFISARGQQQGPPIAFSSSGFVSSVQMNGSASWHYGSDEQSGSVTLQANANGKSRVELRLNRGTRVETQNAFTDADRTCTWSGFDGVAHSTAAHNCWLSAIWFLPQITMQPGAAAPDVVASSQASADGKILRLHHERHPASARGGQTAKLLAQVSAVDLEVDAATGLAQSLLFNAHPDNDAGTDIPTEIQFSDYRAVQGVTIPFHIQKFVNHALVLDLQISDVTVNFGASAAGSSASAAQ